MCSGAGVKDEGKALVRVIKIGCACTPLPASSALTALLLIFVLVCVDVLSLRSRGCFSSQHPCWPEPQGAADCHLYHKSLHTLLL